MSESTQAAPAIDPAKVEFIVIDLETTSREPQNAHIVEWATVMVRPEWFGTGGIEDPIHALVKPPIQIPPETSAIHHIIDADVLRAQTWDKWSPILAGMFKGNDIIAVAHNAAYERTALAGLNLQCRWLCSYKAALRVWPESPGHSNECLRYWLGLGGGRSSNQAPHSAAHDAMVTAQILKELLGKASLEDMLRWTNEPALLPRCPIGTWRNHPWAEVEYSFLEWIIYKARDMREDIIFCAKTEIARREEEYRKARAITHPEPAVTAHDVEDDDLPF